MLALVQERTPGVGSEEDRGKDAQEDDRDGSGEAEVVVDGEREKLCRRMSAIEAALDKACQNEDFDKAGMLIGSAIHAQHSAKVY